MRKKLKVVCTAALCVCVWAHSGWAQEQERTIVPEEAIKATQIIRLHYSGGITPPVVEVKPGTTVIWINGSEAPLEIQFLGKQVTMACKSPVHFVVDESGSFISSRIPQGAVASLCFVEKGEFTYIARVVPSGAAATQFRSDQEFKGMVIVTANPTGQK
jgi:plastocyanin